MIELLKAVYLVGWQQSAEGYNAEYPFMDQGVCATTDKNWAEHRDEELLKLLNAAPEDVKFAVMTGGHINMIPN